jgi:hypothetical protein
MGNPWDGNWLWLWQAGALGKQPIEMAAAARDMGVTGVIVKVHDGRISSPASSKFMRQFRELVGPLKSVGLGVAAWGYVYGSDPDGEADAVLEALSLGAQWYVIDAEVEFEKDGMDKAAARFLSRIFQEVPDAVIGLSSFAVTDLHSKLPWVVFARYCKVMLPQVYWKEIGWPVDNAVRRSLNSYAKLNRPIAPVGQAYGGVPGKEMVRFAELVKSYGCMGISWWSWQHAGKEQIEAIKESGRVFSVGKDYEGRWSEPFIKKVKEMGIMEGYGDGTFRPLQPPTREELAAVVVKLWDAQRKQVAADIKDLADRINDLARKIGG